MSSWSYASYGRLWTRRLAWAGHQVGWREHRLADYLSRELAAAKLQARDAARTQVVPSGEQHLGSGNLQQRLVAGVHTTNRR